MMLLKKHRKPTARELEEQRLAREYSELAQQLEQCRSSFDLATEQDMIDALIYEENSLLSRMAALTKRAREAGYCAQPHELDG